MNGRAPVGWTRRPGWLPWRVLLVLLSAACIPVPAPDFRRPAALVKLEGTVPPGLTVKVCTWSTWHPPSEGCGDITDGMPAVDGIGVPEWSTFPLVLGMESPLWADAFVACDGPTPRGVTLRLPDLQVKYDADVVIRLDAPPTKWGASATRDVDAAAVAALAADLCAGRAILRKD